MKNIFRIFKGNKEIRNQKYYLTNFHGDIIVSNLTKKEADDYIRISYCVSMDKIIKACDAIEDLIKKI